MRARRAETRQQYRRGSAALHTVVSCATQRAARPRRQPGARPNQQFNAVPESARAAAAGAGAAPAAAAPAAPVAPALRGGGPGLRLALRLRPAGAAVLRGASAAGDAGCLLGLPLRLALGLRLGA